LSKDQQNIVVIGSCIIDVTVHVPRFPIIGESLVASRVTTQIGGKASNQAIGISSLGAIPWLITKIGNDNWANLAKNLWKKRNVKTRYVRYDKEEPTGIGIVVMSNDGQNFTLSALNSNKMLSREDIDYAVPIFKKSRVLTIHLNPAIETVEHALAVAKKMGLISLLNASPSEQLPDSIYNLVDVLILNRIEASQLSGINIVNFSDAYSAGQEFIFKGCKAVVISLGHEGLAVITPSHKYSIAAFKVPVMDTSGAGDALAAGLAVALAKNNDILSAAKFACAVSGISVSRFGTWTSMPTKEEVNDFLRGRKFEVIPYSGYIPKPHSVQV